MPNDDLVLNNARRQKSFASPAAKKIAQLRNSQSSDSRPSTSLQRAASLGNIDKKSDMVVRVRSLVEVEDYDGTILTY